MKRGRFWAGMAVIVSASFAFGYFAKLVLDNGWVGLALSIVAFPYLLALMRDIK